MRMKNIYPFFFSISLLFVFSSCSKLRTSASSPISGARVDQDVDELGRDRYTNRFCEDRRAGVYFCSDNSAGRIRLF